MQKFFKTKKAFTMIEMVISIAIVTVIVSVVLYNYGAFNDNLALSVAGQEMSTAVRKAQIYGVSGKETSRGSFTSSYGIYIDPNNPNSYIIFVDKNGNGHYDPVPACGNANSECIEKVALRDGLAINGICATSFAGAVSCPSTSSLKTIQVLFKRPNPEGVIHLVNNDGTTDNTDFQTAQIGLKTPKGTTSSIAIQFTGQSTTNVPVVTMCDRPAPPSGCTYVPADSVSNPQNIVCGMVLNCPTPETQTNLSGDVKIVITPTNGAFNQTTINPYQTTVQIVTNNRIPSVVKSLSTDSNGHFSTLIPDGTYTVLAGNNNGGSSGTDLIDHTKPNCPATPVTIISGQPQNLTIMCDNGQPVITGCDYPNPPLGCSYVTNPEHVEGACDMVLQCNQEN